eukprot:g581.t1
MERGSGTKSNGGEVGDEALLASEMSKMRTKDIYEVTNEYFEGRSFFYTTLKREDEASADFHLAASSCNIPLLKERLQQNSEVLNAKNVVDGGTALHAAAKAGHWKVVELLCNAPWNARNDIQDWAGLTPIYAALMNGGSEVQSYVTMLGGLSPRNNRKQSLLIQAVCMRHVDVVRTLLRIHFRFNAWVSRKPLQLAATDDTRRTALHHACAIGNTQIIRILLGDKSEILQFLARHGDRVRVLVSALDAIVRRAKLARRKRDRKIRLSSDLGRYNADSVYGDDAVDEEETVDGSEMRDAMGEIGSASIYSEHFASVLSDQMIHDLTSVIVYSKSQESVAVSALVVRIGGFCDDAKSSHVNVVLEGCSFQSDNPVLRVPTDAVLVPANDFPNDFVEHARKERKLWLYKHGSTRFHTISGMDQAEDDDDDEDSDDDDLDNEKHVDEGKDVDAPVFDDVDGAVRRAKITGGKVAIQVGTVVEARIVSYPSEPADTDRSWFRGCVVATHKSIAKGVSFDVRFDLEVLGTVTHIEASDVRQVVHATDDDDPTSSDDDLDERIDAAYRKEAVVEQSKRVWASGDLIGGDDGSIATRDEMSSFDIRAAIERVRKAEDAIFERHSGLVDTIDGDALERSGARARHRVRILLAPLSVCVEHASKSLNNVAGLEERDSIGRSPIFHVVASGNMHAIRTIFDDVEKLASKRVGAMDERRRKKEAWASSNRDTVSRITLNEELRLILNLVDNDGVSPLMVAVMSGRLRVVQKLLSLNVDPRVRSFDGMTALRIACEKNHHDIALELLLALKRTGQDDETRRRDAERLNAHLPNIGPYLHWAVYTMNVVIVQSILELGVSVHSIDRATGNSACHLAASIGSLEIVKMLMSFGASPLRRNKYGRTPAMEALETGDRAACEVVCKWLKRWSDVLPSTVAKHLRVRTGYCDEILSRVSAELMRNGRDEILKTMKRLKFDEWACRCVVEEGLSYIDVRRKLMDKVDPRVATTFVEELRRSLYAERVWMWRCAETLPPVKVSAATRSMEKRMCHAFDVSIDRVRRIVHDGLALVNEGKSMRDVFASLISKPVDPLDPRAGAIQKEMADAFVKWAYTVLNDEPDE